MTRETPRDYFERLAPEWDRWREKNRYYHDKVGDLIRGMVPPGARVVQITTPLRASSPAGTGGNVFTLQ